jgi:DNA integrity scanning protein DisA with diadenylate cyclase activity
MTHLLDKVSARAGWCTRDVLEATLSLALEIAHEADEGRRIGTLFTFG